VAEYLGATAREEIAAAQSIVDTHVVLSHKGSCLVCRAPGPCRQYETAAVTFRVYRQLPRRRPGATGPESIGVSSGSWFARTAGGS
jgi:hypothetical protein